jgi:hypothetical protein
MGNKRTSRCTHIGLFLLLLLSGCGSPTQLPARVTNTKAIIRSETPRVVPTKTTTRAMIPSTTLSLTSTSKPVDEDIAHLLDEQTNCEEPCLMGIVPTNTSFTELQSWSQTLHLPLYPDSAYSESELYSSSYKFTQSKNSILTSIDWNFHVTNQVVDGIHFTYETDSGGVIPPFFLPKSILQRYGLPSSTQVFFTWDTESAQSKQVFSYELVFFFAEQNISIEYSSAFKQRLSVDELPICPQKDGLMGFQIWMGTNRPDPPFTDVRYEISKLSDLTTQEFSDLILSDPETVCVIVHQPR